MKLLPSFIRQSGIWVNFFTLLSGTAFAQLIPLLLSPFIARIFSPADFGLLGLFTSIVFPLSSFATGRLELAVLLPDNDHDSIIVVYLSILMNLIVTTILTIVLAFFGAPLLNLLHWNELLPYIYLLPLGVSIIALYTVFNYWFLRKEAYKASSLNRVSQTIFVTGTTILTGIAKIAGGLMIAEVIGRGVALLLAFFQSHKNSFRFFIPTKSDLSRNFKRYKEFPLVSSFTSFLDTFSAYLPAFIVFSYFGKEVAGSFNFSKQMIAAPMLLIASTFSQLILRNLSEKVSKKESIKKEFLHYLKLLLALSSPVCVVVLIAAPWLFELFFGVQWVESGVYSRILALTFLIKFVVSPLSMTFPALNAVRRSNQWQILYFGSMLTLLLFIHMPILYFLLIFSALEVGMYLLYLWLAWDKLMIYEHSLKIN